MTGPRWSESTDDLEPNERRYGPESIKDLQTELDEWELRKVEADWEWAERAGKPGPEVRAIEGKLNQIVARVEELKEEIAEKRKKYEMAVGKPKKV
jgi:ribosome-binding ATPase YchF (GTP1/OBG family)